MKKKQTAYSYLANPFQSLIDITNINLIAAKKLNELQSNFMSYIFDASMQQLKKIPDTKTLTSALDRNLDFYNRIDTQLRGTAEREIETARDAQQAINVIIEETVGIPDNSAEDKS